jgi:hypothetical protein
VCASAGKAAGDGSGKSRCVADTTRQILTVNAATCKRVCRLPSRYQPVFVAFSLNRNRGTPAGVLISACLRTRDEHCLEDVC